MLKLIAVNYTVMLNGYSQWLNIRGKKLFCRGISSIGISDTGLQSKKKKKLPLNKYYKYTVFMLFVH